MNNYKNVKKKQIVPNTLKHKKGKNDHIIWTLKNRSGAINIITELYINIGHDRTHLSFDASDRDNVTCHVTTYTYSRPLLAVEL